MKLINKKNKKDKVIMSTSNTISLKEKFKKYKGKNLSKDFSWDDDIGKEVWK